MHDDGVSGAAQFDEPPLLPLLPEPEDEPELELVEPEPDEPELDPEEVEPAEPDELELLAPEDPEPEDPEVEPALPELEEPELELELELEDELELPELDDEAWVPASSPSCVPAPWVPPCVSSPYGSSPGPPAAQPAEPAMRAPSTMTTAPWFMGSRLPPRQWRATPTEGRFPSRSARLKRSSGRRFLAVVDQ